MIAFYCVVVVAGEEETSILSPHKHGDGNNVLEDWFRQQGGIINKCTYDAKGKRMVATEDIKSGDLLVRGSSDLIFPYGKAMLDSGDYVETAKRLAIALRDNDELKWKPYLDSLPSDCQSAICGNLVKDESFITTRFFDRLVSDYQELLGSESLYILYSISLSRAWPSGMYPVFDRFNHDSEKGNFVYTERPDVNDYNYDDPFAISLSAKVDYKKGDEIFNNYMIDAVGTSKWLFTHNMIKKDVTQDSCGDHVLLKHTQHDSRERARCLASNENNLRFDDVVYELIDALHLDSSKADLPTLKGLGTWLDEHINLLTIHI